MDKHFGTEEVIDVEFLEKPQMWDRLEHLQAPTLTLYTYLYTYMIHIYLCTFLCSIYQYHVYVLSLHEPPILQFNFLDFLFYFLKSERGITWEGVARGNMGSSDFERDSWEGGSGK